jgi:hypothetical protein
MERMDDYSHFDTGYQSSTRPRSDETVMMGQLAKGLASVYRGLLEEPLPERLSSLLKRVDNKTKRHDEA